MNKHWGVGPLHGKLAAAAFALAAGVCAPAHATLVGYQSQALFNGAIAGWSTSSVDFDAIAPGTSYPAGTGPAGLSLTLAGPSAGAGLAPTVSQQFWTTSSFNYLGLDNPDSAFDAGDSLTISFAAPVQAFGLFIIGTQDIGEGDITLASGGAAVGNAASAALTDGNGSFAFFLGLVSDDAGTFSSVTLNNLDPGSTRLLGIALDDFILALDDGGTNVPEPAGVALLLLGALVWRIQARRTPSPVCPG